MEEQAQVWGREYDYPLEVRYGEAGHDGVATLSSLANWLQEAAGRSASSLGFGEETLAGMGLTWILTRLVLRIRRMPTPGESLIVRTWPSVLDRFGYRGYEVFDAKGGLLVSSGSAWSVMDLTARRLTPVPPELAEVYPRQPRPCDAFTCRTLPRLADAGSGPAEGFAAPVRVRRDDLDLNGHVNNARYLSWLLEPLPLRPAGLPPRIPDVVDITFRMECFPGDELTSLCAVMPDETDASSSRGESAPTRLAHAIRSRRNDGRGDDVCRAVTLWTAPPFP